MAVTDSDSDSGIEIDFERVVSDPAYCRRIVEALNRREGLPPVPFQGSQGDARNTPHNSGAGVGLGRPE